jgi:hypothetical protein
VFPGVVDGGMVVKVLLAKLIFEPGVYVGSG